MRLHIVLPWWREPRVQNWTGHRHWLRYTVVWETLTIDEQYRVPDHSVMARALTWRGAIRAREAVLKRTGARHA